MALPVVSPGRRQTGVSKAPRRATIAQVRRSIPVEQYLALLHHAAVTGEIPVFDLATGTQKRDADNQPVFDAISPRDRIAIIENLMDRTMPKIKTVEMAVNDQRSTLDFAQASEEELRQIAGNAEADVDPLTEMLSQLTDAEFEVME